jgi:N-acetylglutamate synthase-like GNAT family acetyltransferase
VSILTERDRIPNRSILTSKFPHTELPMNAPSIEEIDSQDPALAEALACAGLPTEDLVEPGRRFFRFRDWAGHPIGFVGWELAGGTALLRSLVVLPPRRGQGWSRVMTDWALGQLQAAGLADVYVVTVTIEPLARKLGFSTIPRTQAPPEIQASRQLVSLCPAAAVLMHRRLR